MAFYFLLAVFPMLLAAVGLLSMLHLDNHIPTLERFLRNSMPRGAARLILDQLHQVQARRGWPLLFTLLITASYGGRGVSTVLRGVMRAYDLDHRMPSATFLGLGVAGTFVLGLPFLLIGLTLASWFVLWGSAAGWMPTPLGFLVGLLRWPILFMPFQQLVNALYRLGTRGYVPWRWFSRGSAFATIAWIVVTYFFELYVRTIANLGATYGSLGTVVGLLLYAHVISVCVLIGAEIDADRFNTRAQQR
jgi:membrane protein